MYSFIALNPPSAQGLLQELRIKLLNAPFVDVKRWQSQDISDKPEMITQELAHVNIELPIYDEDILYLEPNLPWAEDHFMERISGYALNPPPSEAYWPYAQQGNKSHKQGEQFSHTYPERFWPKFANEGNTRPNGRQVFVPHNGIRYEYGDLGNVVELLAKEPYTRQAYLPVWFPEDTGATEGQRVPCTLGYHFLNREYLDITYHIRSCDFVRHFRDDAYMAMRLCQWVAGHTGLKPGKLIMNIGSLHIFQGDRYGLSQEVDKFIDTFTNRLLGAL